MPRCGSGFVDKITCCPAYRQKRLAWCTTLCCGWQANPVNRAAGAKLSYIIMPADYRRPREWLGPSIGIFLQVVSTRLIACLPLRHGAGVIQCQRIQGHSMQFCHGCVGQSLCCWCHSAAGVSLSWPLGAVAINTRLDTLKRLQSGRLARWLRDALIIEPYSLRAGLMRPYVGATLGMTGR